MQITQILQIFHLTQKKSFNLTQISQISQKAMRHDYPHAETQRAQRSRREFYFEHGSTGFHGLMMRGY